MSKLFSKDTPLIGLDISTSSVRAMSVDAKKWVVNGYGSLDLDPLELKDAIESGKGQYLSENIKLLFSEKIVGTIPSKKVAVSLPTARTYCRTFTLPFSAEKHIKDAVILEADQFIPVPSSTLYIDHEIVERDKKTKTLTVLMSAISKSIVDNAISAVISAGLDPVIVEPSISAVTRLLTLTEDATLPTVVVDIGPSSTDIAVLDNGTLRVTGGTDVGGNTFTLEIAKKLNIALENAHQLKVLNGLNAGPRQERLKSALDPSLQRVLTEVKKVMRYYSERIDSTKKLEQLLVVGSGSNLPGIGEFFTENLIIAARVASPWQKLDFNHVQEPPKQFRPRYISVAGLASIKPEEVWK